jgi:hypothetical protein
MTTASAVFGRQWAHCMWLCALLIGVFLSSNLPGFRIGEFLGISTPVWVVLCLADAIVHQIFVWFCWRTELYGKLLTRLFGKAAFPGYAFIFAVLILARPVLITALAVSNAGTVPAGESVLRVIAALFLIPSVYLIYSVKRYFGFSRAFGIDHFDHSYRFAGMVREGIFRYSSNAMYVFGFLALWIPGLALGSIAALVVAAFSHLYIRVHYLCTEKPDMDYIYGSQGDNRQN